MEILIITQKVDKKDQNLGFFHEWVMEFSKHCDSVIVVCLEAGFWELPANVKVFSLGKEGGVSRIKYIYRFYKYIWRERKNYEAVFVHMNPEYILLGSILWKLLRKKVTLWYTHKAVNPRLIVAEKLADSVYSASKESFRLSSSKLFVTGHGIDTDYFSFSPNLTTSDRDVRIITVGRISRVKNYETIIRAVKVLKDKKFKVNLTIVGGQIDDKDNGYFESLKKLVLDLNLSENVLWVGSVPHDKILDYLRKADIFVNTSKTGSLDKAGMEALSAGVAFFTSNEAYASIFLDRKDEYQFAGDDYLSLSLKLENYLKKNVKDKKIDLEFLSNEIANRHSLKELVPKIINNISSH